MHVVAKAHEAHCLTQSCGRSTRRQVAAVAAEHDVAAVLAADLQPRPTRTSSLHAPMLLRACWC